MKFAHIPNNTSYNRNFKSFLCHRIRLEIQESRKTITILKSSALTTSKINSKVKGYKLIKNYGKSIALDFSFRKAKGDFLITMDADLQDDPEEIGNLLNQLNKSDCVIGWKKIRHDPLVKTIPSKIFNFACRKIFKLDIQRSCCFAQKI